VSALAVERTIVVGVSHFGRGGLAWLALAPIVGSGKRPLSRLEASTFSAAAVGSALLLSMGLARVVARTRPCHGRRSALIPCPDGGSFPSDQVAAAFAAAEMIGWFDPRLRVPLAVSGAAIAVARVVAGVHYPTDVAGGAALGLLVGGAARSAAAQRSEHRRSAARRGLSGRSG
jgi:undecaprenyl-diphosphatase